MTWNAPRRRGLPPPPPFKPALEILEERIALNNAPILTLPAMPSNYEGQSVSLLVTASDADSDSLTFSVTGLPEGLSMNPTTGLITGVVGYDNVSTGMSPEAFSPTVTVTDGTDSVSDSFDWTIDDTNRLPSPGEQWKVEGETISLAMQGTDATGSNTLAYSATDLPSGLTINPSTGLIDGVIRYSNASSDSSMSFTATVTLSDNNNGVDIYTFDWFIQDTNRLPSPSPL